MSERKESASIPSAAGAGVTISRRQALSVAGALVATANVASAQSLASTVGAQSSARPLGLAPQPAHAVEFVARFAQTGSTGQDFTSFGYLTRVAGAVDGDLFSGSVRNETTALFTAFAEGKLVQRNIDQVVHSMDIEGTMTIYQRTSPGAAFDSPNSFRDGVPVAEFEMTLQDILTVILPGKGIPTLTGAMRQTRADGLVGRPTGGRFGHVGSRAQFFASGLGTLIDPVTLNSILQMAGYWAVE
jgi:hypothetical protein